MGRLGACNGIIMQVGHHLLFAEIFKDLQLFFLCVSCGNNNQVIWKYKKKNVPKQSVFFLNADALCLSWFYIVNISDGSEGGAQWSQWTSLF